MAKIQGERNIYISFCQVNEHLHIDISNWTLLGNNRWKDTRIVVCFTTILRKKEEKKNTYEKRVLRNFVQTELSASFLYRLWRGYFSEATAITQTLLLNYSQYASSFHPYQRGYQFWPYYLRCTSNRFASFWDLLTVMTVILNMASWSVMAMLCWSHCLSLMCCHSYITGHHRVWYLTSSSIRRLFDDNPS